jgi:hypothetical protein
MVLICGAALLSGCGGSSGPPPTAKATGQVTHKSKPVTEGEIYFVAAEKGYSANATLGADGKYQITSGLPPAKYKVFISRPRITKPPMAGEAPPEVKEFLVPNKYQSETTSGLTAEVKAGDNTFDFPVD